MKKIVTIIYLLFCVFLPFKGVAQVVDIERVNAILDSVPYYHLSILSYKTNIKLPDSIQTKVINILNGYLPSQTMKDATSLNDNVIKNINRMTSTICGNDSICFKLVKDSIREQTIKTSLSYLRARSYPPAFVLAIGTWNVKNAIPILSANIKNPRYPKHETLLALAKLGNDSIKGEINTQYTLDYIINNTILQKKSNQFIYRNIPISEQMNYLVSSFFEVGMYLQDKGILLKMVDLLDITGKEVHIMNVLSKQKSATTEQFIPIEQSTLMWLGTCFIENQNWDKWAGILERYSLEIDKNENRKELKLVLSTSNKKEIKKLLKQWINDNVIF